MARLVSLLLAGCVIVGGDAHQQRIDALGGVPTDVPTETGDTDDTDLPASAPVLTSVEVRLRTNEFGFFRGLQLLVQVTDADGDLLGGELQIQGGETVAWSEAIALEDDTWAVPIELDLGEPCAEPTPVDLNVFVRDSEGHTSDTRQTTATWEYRHHDESQITSANQCEPCVGQIEPDDLPVIVCGRLGSNHGYSDGIDSMHVLLAPTSPRITAVANLESVSNTVSFNYGTETEDLISIPATSGSVGLTIDVPSPEAPVVNYLYVRADDTIFATADWRVFVDRTLPARLP